MKNSSEVYWRDNNGPKTLSSGTPATALTSLLQQPSTTTCCVWFDKNRVDIDNTELQYSQTSAYIYRENALMVDPVNGFAGINRMILASCPLLNVFWSVWNTHKIASQVTRLFRYANWVVRSTPLRSTNRPRRTHTTRSNTHKHMMTCVQYVTVFPEDN